MTFTVAVSRRALIKRINRTLSKEGKRLRVARAAEVGTLGELFVTDASNHVVRRRVDLQKLGRDLGTLKPYEKVGG